MINMVEKIEPINIPVNILSVSGLNILIKDKGYQIE